MLSLIIAFLIGMFVGVGLSAFLIGLCMAIGDRVDDHDNR